MTELGHKWRIGLPGFSELEQQLGVCTFPGDVVDQG